MLLVMNPGQFDVILRENLFGDILSVQAVLTEGYRTGDIMSEGCTRVGTCKMGDLIAERIG